MGYAADAAPGSRPGVPRERRDPDLLPHGELAEPQPHAEVLSDAGLRTRTPVFGTAQPARGLSGAVRRAAYRLPEHRPTRWVLLLAADRLDVLEHRARSGWWILPAAVSLAVGYAAVRRAAARR